MNGTNKIAGFRKMGIVEKIAEALENWSIMHMGYPDAILIPPRGIMELTREVEKRSMPLRGYCYSYPNVTYQGMRIVINNRNFIEFEE